MRVWFSGMKCSQNLINFAKNYCKFHQLVYCDFNVDKGRKFWELWNRPQYIMTILVYRVDLSRHWSEPWRLKWSQLEGLLLRTWLKKSFFLSTHYVQPQLGFVQTLAKLILSSQCTMTDCYLQPCNHVTLIKILNRHFFLQTIIFQIRPRHLCNYLNSKWMWLGLV